MKYEYQTIMLTYPELLTAVDLNKLGKEGWQLVSTTPRPGDSWPGAGAYGVYCVLMREKE